MIMKNSFNLQDDVQKRNLKNSILGFVRSGWGLLVILMLSACLFNFGEYPSKYYDYEWTEITETQARELWKTYDTTTKLHSTAKVYKDYPKKGYIVPDCKVVKDTLHDVKYYDEKNIKINGYDAITWVQTYGATDRMYVFIKDDEVYEIICPGGFEYKELVEEFIESIRIG